MAASSCGRHELVYPHCNDSVVGPVIPILREHLKKLRDRLARAAYERDIDSIESLLSKISIVRTTMARTKHLWRIARFSTPQKKRTIQLR